MVACATDYLDGYVARTWSQVSKLGQFLDPTADKLLIASSLLMLAGFNRISHYALIPAIVILCREIMVSGLRETLLELNVPMPVTRLAKWKTACQMLAIAMLMINQSMHSIIDLQMWGECFLWVAAMLTLITGSSYLRAGLKHFK
jgi:cardiolipin synthase